MSHHTQPIVLRKSKEVHTVVSRGPPPSQTGKLGVSKSTGTKGPGVKGSANVAAGSVSSSASLASDGDDSCEESAGGLGNICRAISASGYRSGKQRRYSVVSSR